MKNLYISPKISVFEFSVSDVITTSGISIANTNDTTSYASVDYAVSDALREKYDIWTGE